MEVAVRRIVHTGHFHIAGLPLRNVVRIVAAMAAAAPVDHLDIVHTVLGHRHLIAIVAAVAIPEVNPDRPDSVDLAQVDHHVPRPADIAVARVIGGYAVQHRRAFGDRIGDFRPGRGQGHIRRGTLSRTVNVIPRKIALAIGIPAQGHLAVAAGGRKARGRRRLTRRGGNSRACRARLARLVDCGQSITVVRPRSQAAVGISGGGEQAAVDFRAVAIEVVAG